MTAWWFVLACFGGMFIAGAITSVLDTRTYRGPDVEEEL